MSILTVTTKIDRRYLERKTKAELAQMYLDLCDQNEAIVASQKHFLLALRDGVDTPEVHCLALPLTSSWRYVVDKALERLPCIE